MNKGHKKVWATASYIKHFLILTSTIVGCISIFAFASFLDIPIGIMKSAIGSNICAITAEIKKYKSITKKKKQDKIALLAISNINNKVLILEKS